MNSSDLGEAMRLDTAARAHEKPLAEMEARLGAAQDHILRLANGYNEMLKRFITFTEIVEKQGDRIKALEARLDRLVPNVAQD